MTAIRTMMFPPWWGIYRRKACLGKIEKIPLWLSKPSLMVVLRSFDLLMSFFRSFRAFFIASRLSLLGLVINYLGAWFCSLGDHRLHGSLACVVLL
ncbi:unnamed protein product [Prunus brigantina]